MKKIIRIKLSKVSVKSKNNITKRIIVTYNQKSQGGYILDKIGVVFNDSDRLIIFISTKRLLYWLKRNVEINHKVSKILGILGQSEN